MGFTLNTILCAKFAMTSICNECRPLFWRQISFETEKILFISLFYSVFELSVVAAFSVDFGLPLRSGSDLKRVRRPLLLYSKTDMFALSK